jgi:hypothetical protein
VIESLRHERAHTEIDISNMGQEEASNLHQAAMVTIDVNQAKMENQEIIPGVKNSGDEICAARNWKR